MFLLGPCSWFRPLPRLGIAIDVQIMFFPRSGTQAVTRSDFAESIGRLERLKEALAERATNPRWVEKTEKSARFCEEEALFGRDSTLFCEEEALFGRDSTLFCQEEALFGRDSTLFGRSWPLFCEDPTVFCPGFLS